MKIGAVIQARVSSKRLPGKVLKTLPFGKSLTVLQQVIRRLKKVKRLDDIIVATSSEKGDGEIIKISEKENIKWFKGSLDDVLERYYLTAKENELEVIVRITSDCPCIDFEVVDLVIDKHLKHQADYTSNVLFKRTYPHGLDVEVLSFSALEKAYKEGKSDFDREHVCPYLYQTNPQSFNIQSVEAPFALTAPHLRVTLDTEEDYALLCTIFDNLYFKKEYFKASDLIKLFKEKPWLELINKKIIRKKKCDTLEEEISEAIKVLDLQELKRVRELLEKI